MALLPVYNDWEAVSLVLNALDVHLRDSSWAARVVLVDDGSDDPGDAQFGGLCLSAITQVLVVTLRRNMGHQRAIAMGLAYVEANLPCDAVIVMDGDGEDRPEDVPRLLERMRCLNDTAIVFAERSRRLEGVGFRLSYALYRYLHRALTGIPVKVGNFSAIPFRLLRRLIVVSELWNHYAAAVFLARLPRATVPTTRGCRLHGRSKMNFVSLVGHGLSALSVHSETMSVRLLVAGGVSVLAIVAALVTLAVVATSHGSAVPGWMGAVGVLGGLLLVQVVALLAVFALTSLRARSAFTFIPARDYVHFIEGARSVAGRPA